MKIIVISSDALNRWNEAYMLGLSQESLTDAQFEEIAENFGGWTFSSYEGLISEMNSNGPCAPVPEKHFIRVIDDKDGSAQIPAWVSKEDLDALGYDTSGVDIDMLEEIADRMSDDFHEQLYDEVLIQAADHEGLPLKKDVEDARKKWDECGSDAVWEPYDKPDSHTQECNVVLEADDFLFEGTGSIVDGVTREIESLECTLPNGRTVTLI